MSGVELLEKFEFAKLMQEAAKPKAVPLAAGAGVWLRKVSEAQAKPKRAS